MAVGRIVSPRPVVSTAGLHYLSGRTRVAGNPDIASPYQIVQLLQEKQDTRLVLQTLSDGRGVWRFSGIAPRQLGYGYTVIAYDSSGTYDPAAKDNQIPMPMPPEPSEH